MNSGDSVTVQGVLAAGGELRVPGDKSISHRVAMLSALAAGEGSIAGFLRSEDCLCTLNALAQLGAGVAVTDAAITVGGVGGRFRAPAAPLDLGNSGTGMRLLCGLLAGQPFTAELTGDASLRSRPMSRIREPLERMGAQVALLGEGGRAPIRVTGGGLRGIDYALPVASAQVKSCVLLAGLFADGRTRVVEPQPTRDHTERLLRAMGARVNVDGLRIEIEGAGGGAGLRLPARDWRVPGDFSSAAFWLTAAACCPGASLRVEGVGLNPRRTALLAVLRRMGAQIEAAADEAPDSPEPCGTVTVRGAGLRATEVGGAEIPNLIDEIPLIAVAGAFAEGRTVIRDARELRVKESDRIATMAANLRAAGAAVEEFEDGMAIAGPAALAPCAADSHGDHRVAMAMSVLALASGKSVCVRDVACVATSYPGFWADAERIGARIEWCDRS
ncbi:MAG: 3-phosphoshikimate 1-carboxyvinyltransferase [Planctomycetes bacterium]|nr:3-phosphoshikimate 1-carboxyvinyltransferase [Planctomycetota bacterium]